ncbi:hypothetical protein Aduo_006128 [Ancylostoma duodenale]
MNYEVFFSFVVVSTTEAIWPDVLKPDESAALDFVMRVSRLSSKDLIYIENQQFLGNKDDAITEKAKKENPLLHEKMMRFLEKYNKLSKEAREYVNEGFSMAMKHVHFYGLEQYYSPEQLNEAARFVGKLKLLPILGELVKAFPDIDATPPLSD